MREQEPQVLRRRRQRRISFLLISQAMFGDTAEALVYFANADLSFLCLFLCFHEELLNGCPTSGHPHI